MEIYMNLGAGVINYIFLSPFAFNKKKVNKKLMTTDVSIMLISIKEDLKEAEGNHEAYCVLWYTNL